MKEWALKHPVMTFLLVSSAIEGVVKVVKLAAVVLAAGKIPVSETVEETAEETKEETHDESGNDIQ